MESSTDESSSNEFSLVNRHENETENSPETPDSVPETTNASTKDIEIPVPNVTENKKEPQVSTNHPQQSLDPPSFRWFVLVLSTISILLASVQGSALIVALPDVLEGLDAQFTTIMWVLFAYLIVITALVPITGEISDIFGRRRVFNLGFTLFTAASLYCGLADSKFHGWDLVGGRIVQGFGAAALFSNSGAIVTDVFIRYNQVGLAMGVNQITSAVGSILGPFLGGVFSTDWRWVFLFNVPIGGIGIILCFWKMHERPSHHKAPMMERIKKFDWFGSILFLIGDLLFLSALCTVAVPDMPNAVMISFFVFGGVSLLVSLSLETWIIKAPALHLRIFLIRKFAVANLGSLLCSFARSVVLFATIFFFQGPFGKTPFYAGVMTIPFGFGVLILGFWAGRLSDRYGPKVMQVVGPLIAGAGSFGLAYVDQNTSYVAIAAALIVSGAGQGIFNSPNSASAMVSVPKELRGGASGWRMMVAFLAQTFALVLLFSVVRSYVPLGQLMELFLYGGGGNSMDLVLKGIHINFYVASGVAWAVSLESFILLVLLPGKRAAHKRTKKSSPSDANGVQLP
jgi:MFS family permease